MVGLYVALGGALGALARYGLSSWMVTRVGEAFPWGTLVVNIVGSFVLGLLYRFLDTGGPAGQLRPLLAVGVLGAFTTFSTFTLEAYALFRAGAHQLALLYLLGSVGLGLLAVAAGAAAAGALPGLRQ